MRGHSGPAVICTPVQGTIERMQPIQSACTRHLFGCARQVLAYASGPPHDWTHADFLVRGHLSEEIPTFFTAFSPCGLLRCLPVP